MAKIIITLIKYSDRDWANVFKNGVYTEAASDVISPEEVVEVLIPYQKLVLSLPGFMPEKSESVFNGDVNVRSMQFDTLENAQSAYNILFGDSTSPEVAKFRELITGDKYKHILAFKSSEKRIVNQ